MAPHLILLPDIIQFKLKWANLFTNLYLLVFYILKCSSHCQPKYCHHNKCNYFLGQSSVVESLRYACTSFCGIVFDIKQNWLWKTQLTTVGKTSVVWSFSRTTHSIQDTETCFYLCLLPVSGIGFIKQTLS